MKNTHSQVDCDFIEIRDPCCVFTAHFHNDTHKRKLLQVNVVVLLVAKDDWMRMDDTNNKIKEHLACSTCIPYIWNWTMHWVCGMSWVSHNCDDMKMSFRSVCGRAACIAVQYAPTFQRKHRRNTIFPAHRRDFNMFWYWMILTLSSKPELKNSSLRYYFSSKVAFICDWTSLFIWYQA